MPTREDVAKLAGVSSTSVSYYVNKTGYVSKEHGEKIQLAIDMLGYKPNFVAKSLKTKNSKQLVLLCNQVKNPFHADLISKITEIAYKEGFMMLFSNVLTEKDYIDRICSYQVDGVFIVSDNVLPADINRICSHGINVVLINNMTWTDVDRRVSRISIDLTDSVKSLVSMVLQKGNTNCLCITSLQHEEQIENDKKLIGVKEAFIENNIPLKNENFLLHINSEEDIHKALPDIINGKNPPDAYVCCNDSTALSVLGLLNRYGIDVPGKVIVTGIDNIPSSQFSYPKLTTVDIPAGEIAIQAMKIMVDKTKGNEVQDYAVKTKVILRETL